MCHLDAESRNYIYTHAFENDSDKVEAIKLPKNEMTKIADIYIYDEILFSCWRKYFAAVKI